MGHFGSRMRWFSECIKINAFHQAAIETLFFPITRGRKSSFLKREQEVVGGWWHELVKIKIHVILIAFLNGNTAIIKLCFSDISPNIDKALRTFVMEMKLLWMHFKILHDASLCDNLGKSVWLFNEVSALPFCTSESEPGFRPFPVALQLQRRQKHAAHVCGRI